MFGIYTTFGIITALIWLGTIIQTFKTFREAGIKGKAIFVSIISIIYVIAFAVPIIVGREAFFEVNPKSQAEGVAAIATMSSFFGAWLLASIVSLIGRKYANNHMPVFAPTQVLPNTGIMGSQGYSGPVYPPSYPQQIPPNQYYGYGQGGMPSAPQGYPMQAPMGYQAGQVNPYAQVQPQGPITGYAPYPYDANGIPAQEQMTSPQQPVQQENQDQPQ